MEAIQFSRYENKLELVQRTIPKIKNNNEILVRILYSGISKLDVFIIDNGLHCNPYSPFVPGREICGIVKDIGKDVFIVREDDKVVVNPYSSCEVCDYCRSGTPHLCLECALHKTLGIYKDGGWADYILVPQTQVYRLPDKLPIQLGILTNKMSCIGYCWNLISPISLDKSILILGAGISGLLWTTFLHYRGYRKVTVSEPNLSRHENLQQMQIRFDIITPKIVCERQIREADFYFDVIIDCSGSMDSLEKAFTLLNSGGKLCIFNQLPTRKKISISPYEIQRKQVTILGVGVGVHNYIESLTVLECLCEKYLTYERLGIKTYDLDDYKDAVNHSRKGSVMKAVFRMPNDCKCQKIVIPEYSID